MRQNIAYYFIKDINNKYFTWWLVASGEWHHICTTGLLAVHTAEIKHTMHLYMHSHLQGLKDTINILT